MPKVWLNSNLASNKVKKIKDKSSLPYSQANLNQLYIRKIFDMVESRTIGQSLPSALKDRFRTNNFKTHFQALNCI